MVLVAFVVTSGCAMRVGHHNRASYTSLNNITYESRSENVLAFYEGSPPTEPYIQLGIVEAEGNKYASNDQMLNYLKYEALQNGADAIINVKKYYKGRETGTAFDTIVDKNHKREVYESLVMEGLAIRFKDYGSLPTETKDYLSKKDESLYEFIESEKQEKKENVESDLSETILIWLIAAFAVAHCKNCN